MFAGAGETITIYNDPQIKVIDSGGGGGTLQFTMNYTLNRTFRVTTNIVANTVFSILQTTRARNISIKFSATAGVVLTLWAGTVMSNVQFNAATREFTITDTGAYTLQSFWDGIAWNTQIIGPDNV